MYVYVWLHTMRKVLTQTTFNPETFRRNLNDKLL